MTPLHLMYASCALKKNNDTHVFDPEFSNDDVIDRTTDVLPRVYFAKPTNSPLYFASVYLIIIIIIIIIIIRNS